jgi:DUF1680 family protein
MPGLAPAQSPGVPDITPSGVLEVVITPNGKRVIPPAGQAAAPTSNAFEMPVPPPAPPGVANVVLPPGGVLTPEAAAAGGDGETIHGRSVSLSSERLRLVAKLDLVEGENGVVAPVDYKRGAPREGADGLELWDADRVQLAAQAIVLRENGYRCEEGIVYYVATRQRVRVPVTGVTLQGGVFQTAMEDNISYLLNSYSVDDLLRQFRERVGTAKPPEKPTGDLKFWEEDLAGSNAGRFLMAAGNTLRWIDHPELRRRLDAVVDGIAQRRQPNGYIMAYPEGTIFYSERGAYTRAWLVHGLIEAGYAGNPKAFELLRGYSDWFNQCSYLPQLLRFAVQGGQGMIANTRMYFTPVGKPADIQVIQRYFQENYWMEQLAAREDRAIWQYPYDRPHCYLLTNVEAYMDLYRATGDTRYLNAVEGAWELYHDKWENPGGSISIIEFVVSPPKSYRLDAELEELCGNSFWAFLSQRFHLLDPENEKYVTEIEKSIYNVGLANQAGSQGFRYHALLAHRKEKPTRMNTCCEGQGTRLIGSLPEHIYSLASDGLYVNLFEPSSIHWTEGGASLRVKMVTRFPFDSEVRLQFSAARPTQAKIRIRVPSWTTQEMAVYVNGKPAATGKPASYVVLDAAWADGDVATFTLPAALGVEQYTGVDQIPDHARFAVSFGPILLAAVGAPEIRLRLENVKHPEDLLKHIKPKPGQPLHFLVENNPGVEFMPYWQVDNEPFNCFPAVDMRA